MSDTVKVGKAKITVDSSGCVACGTEFSSGWRPAQTVEILVGGRRLEIEISVCADCKNHVPKIAKRAAFS